MYGNVRAHEFQIYTAVLFDASFVQCQNSERWIHYDGLMHRYDWWTEGCVTLPLSKLTWTHWRENTFWTSSVSRLCASLRACISECCISPTRAELNCFVETMTLGATSYVLCSISTRCSRPVCPVPQACTCERDHQQIRITSTFRNNGIPKSSHFNRVGTIT